MAIIKTYITNYSEKLFDTLKYFENNNYDDKIHLDTVHIPTIGIGYALLELKAGVYSIRPDYITDLNNAGITFDPTLGAALEDIRDALNGLPGFSYTYTEGTNTFTVHKTGGDAVYHLDDYLTVSETQGKNLFDHVITDYQTTLGNRIGTQLVSDLSGSRELIALMSLEYNNGSALIGPGLKAALNSGNRAKAWYEIRYNSNGEATLGIAKRRYIESELFGLYNDVDNPTYQESSNLFEVYDDHTASINSYDDSYINSQAIVSGSTTREQFLTNEFNYYEANIGIDLDINSIKEELLENPHIQLTQPLSDYLINVGSNLDSIIASNNLSTKIDSDKEYLLLSTIESIDIPVNGFNANFSYRTLTDGDNEAEGIIANDFIAGLGGNDTIKGNGGHDILIGGTGNDELDGGSGNDTLDGGAGNDFLYGGIGDDTYIVDTDGDAVRDAVGEGNDTVKIKTSFTLHSTAEIEKMILLEGGTNATGNDFNQTITGNNTANILQGGGGKDDLEGGAGNDRLEGGAGIDAYRVGATFGNDTIIDSDKKGGIIYDKTLMLGGEKVEGSNNLYKDNYGNQFVWNGTNGSDLVINGNVTVQNFHNGDLLIHLEDNGDDDDDDDDGDGDGDDGGDDGRDDDLREFLKGLPPGEDIKIPQVPPYSGDIPPEGSGGGPGCEGGFNDAETMKLPDPLIVDLNKDSILETTTVENGVYFDHSGDGFAELSAWVGAGDGLIVKDINENGFIDDGSELIVDFQALSAYDSDNNEIIDLNDTEFNNIQILQGDGNLLTLAEAGIKSIDLSYTNVNTTDENGNPQISSGTFTWDDDTTGLIGGFNFQIDVTDAKETDLLDVSSEIQALPDVRSFGTIHSLHQAMVRDTSGTLQGLIESFVAEADSETRKNLIKDIIYNWAGVTEVDPDSRGGIFDAQKLEALEAFMGRSYNGTEGPNPIERSVVYLNKAFYDLSEYISAKLMLQSHISSLSKMIEINYNTDAQEFSLSLLPVADEIVNQINTDEAAGEAMLREFMRAVKGLDLIPMISDYQEFSETIALVDPDYAFLINTTHMDFIYGTVGNDSGPDSISGTGIDEAIFGLDGNDSIHARMGNDFVDGGPGNDTIDTCFGDDTIIASWGNDSLNGGDGYDTYIYAYGDGNDTIYDVDNSGKVIFDGITLDQVSFSPKEHFSILPYTIDHPAFWVHMKDGSSSVAILNLDKPVVFDDGEITYSEIFDRLEERGTEFNDRIYGSSYDEVLRGFEGDDLIVSWSSDTIYGGDGNDRIHSHEDSLVYGGTGNDTIYSDGGGDMTIIGGPGNDYLDSDKGYGRNVFIFAEGDGDDTIDPLTDDFVFDDITMDQAQFSAIRTDYSYDVYDYDSNNWVDTWDNHIIVKYGNQGDQVRMRFQFIPFYYDERYHAEREDYIFEDGTLTYFDVITMLETLGTDSDETIYGSDYNETIKGFAGNDSIIAYGGDDTIYGGLGDDVYVVENAGDVVIENASEGTDTVQSSVDYTLTANVENLELTGSAITGTGNNSENIIIGNALNNSIYGGNGLDTLYGGAGDDIIDGGLHIDSMIGGLGDDVYYVDQYFDEIIENVGEGTDSVYSTTNYNLNNCANVENATLLGDQDINLTGNALDNGLAGNSGNNIIYGNDGNDTIDGGAGVDTMQGGYGDDIYYVDNVNDAVTEFSNQGNDKIFSSIDYTLANNVEILELTGSATTATGNSTENIIIGNELNNFIYGGSGLDTLYGGAGDDIIDGGLHIDSMIGGLGNDTYYVNEYFDEIVENTDEGTDLIYSTIHYNLSNTAANVENLVLLGDTNLNVTGNDLSNSLTGNAGNNILYGKDGDDTIDGGIGADTMQGGHGDDVYYVDNVNDAVIEFSNQGSDTVLSSIDYTLANNVENLELAGSSDINGTGNTLDNSITGNTGNNALYGAEGNDIYNFFIGGSIDTISDISGTADEISFDSTVSKSDIAFYQSGSNLYVDYGTTAGNDKITVLDQDTNTIERFELSNGEYLSNADVNNIIAYITAYDAADGDVDFTSVEDVKGDSTLMAYIAGQWHS